MGQQWYDYFLCSTAASIVFNRLYFVSGDPVVATLAAFASFAVGFVARPIGAVVSEFVPFAATAVLAASGCGSRTTCAPHESARGSRL
ncbi:hypothetical protein [Saccharopolyspora shandongensis]|uniref:hypothetical protein n=1 Tax=Saccharopolyspora shandongensis TaxID=418495 RepID=UPI003F4D0DCC